MTTEDKIKDEKLEYDVNREAAKISALSSGKIDKYEYLTGEEMLLSNKQQIIEQARFIHSPFGKVFEKQTKTVEDQGEKEIKAIQDNKRQLINNDNYKDKLLLSKEREIFKDIYNKRLDKIRRGNKNANQKRILANINIHFNARNSAIKLMEDYGSMILEAKKLAKEQEGTGIKILTPNQMLKRLPIALAQIKTDNNSESFLNEGRLLILCIDQK